MENDKYEDLLNAMFELAWQKSVEIKALEQEKVSCEQGGTRRTLKFGNCVISATESWIKHCGGDCVKTDVVEKARTIEVKDPDEVCFRAVKDLGWRKNVSIKGLGRGRDEIHEMPQKDWLYDNSKKETLKKVLKELKEH